MVLWRSRHYHSTSIRCDLFDEIFSLFSSSSWYRNSRIQSVTVRLPIQCSNAPIPARPPWNPHRKSPKQAIGCGFARTAAPAHFVGRSERNEIAFKAHLATVPPPTPPSLLFPSSSLPSSLSSPLSFASGCSQRAHWHGSRVAPYSKCVCLNDSVG